MIKERFNQAVLFVRTPPSDITMTPSIDQKLEMYALYKQATVGPCSQHGGTKPWAVQVEACSKWNAWNNLEDMPHETAMTKYIALLNAIVPEWQKW